MSPDASTIAPITIRSSHGRRRATGPACGRLLSDAASAATVTAGSAGIGLEVTGRPDALRRAGRFYQSALRVTPECGSTSRRPPMPLTYTRRLGDGRIGGW